MSIPLFLLTFNCGKLKINSGDFTDQLQLILPESPPDLFVFGFQEVCSILDGSFPQRVRKHVIDINRIVIYALKKKYNIDVSSDLAFTTVAMHHVGAIAMLAISPFASKFSTVKFADASCGNGNSSLKGGVGLRLRYQADLKSKTTELTFATAHLSAYEGQFYYERRLQDIQTIMRALDFGDGYSFLKPNSHSFFMGDLNFRTTKDGEAIEELLTIQDTSDAAKPSSVIPGLIAKYDELTKGRIDGEVFSGFDEACINFRPTYKYHLNTAIYNSKRSPSWCDRILFQSTYKKGGAKIHKYDCVSAYLGSDHRPVYLSLSVPVEAPEPIIGSNGYLVVLPVASHLEHNGQNKDFDPSSAVSGPTQVYMKFTPLDRLTQYFVRRVSDSGIGYSLWLATTSAGRVTLLACVLALWVISSL